MRIPVRKSFICALEGQQEKKYLNHLSSLIKKSNDNAMIIFNECKNITSLCRKSSSIPKIAVFDFDSNKIDFENKIKLCKGIKPIYSSLNFDLWLLLHKVKFRSPVTNNNDYIYEIRKAYNLPKNANIKNDEIIDRMLKQITLDDVKFAIANAEEIMNNKDDRDKIMCGKFIYYPNPSMNIHKFIKEILEECELI